MLGDLKTDVILSSNKILAVLKEICILDSKSSSSWIFATWVENLSCYKPGPGWDKVLASSKMREELIIVHHKEQL